MFHFVIVLAVLGDMMFAGLRRMMVRMRRMSVGRICVMRGGFVISVLVMPCGFTVVPGRMLVMFGRVMVVVGCRVRVFHHIL